MFGHGFIAPDLVLTKTRVRLPIASHRVMIRGQVALVLDIPRTNGERVVDWAVEERGTRSYYKIARVDDHFDAAAVAVGRPLESPVEAGPVDALLIIRVARVALQIVIG